LEPKPDSLLLFSASPAREGIIWSRYGMCRLQHDFIEGGSPIQVKYTADQVGKKQLAKSGSGKTTYPVHSNRQRILHDATSFPR
jgi:hypothetical protein